MILITLSNGTICSFWHGLNDSDSFEFRLYVVLWHLEHSIWVGACEFLRPHSGAWTTQDHSDNSRWDFGSSGNLDGLLKVLVGDITVLLMFLCFESCHWKTPAIFKKKRVFKYSSIVVHQFGVATVKLSLYAMWVFLSFMVSLAGAGFTPFFEWMIFTKNLSGRCIFRTEVVINWIWSSGNPCRRHGNGNPWKWKLKMKVGFFQGL